DYLRFILQLVVLELQEHARCRNTLAVDHLADVAFDEGLVLRTRRCRDHQRRAKQKQTIPSGPAHHLIFQPSMPLYLITSVNKNFCRPRVRNFVGSVPSCSRSSAFTEM